MVHFNNSLLQRYTYSLFNTDTQIAVLYCTNT